MRSINVSSNVRIKAFAVITLLILLFSRNFTGFMNPMFHAEDGLIYFQQNITLGLHAIFTPYGGTLMILHRLISLLASQFSFEWQPALYHYIALLLFIFVVIRILNNNVELPFKVKFSWCLLLVMVPTTGVAFMLLTGVGFITGLFFIVLLIQRAPSNRADEIIDYIVLLLFGLSGPLGALFSPLFLLKAYLDKTKYSYRLLACIIFIALIQTYIKHSTQGWGGKIDLGNLNTLLVLQWWGTAPWSILFGIALNTHSLFLCFILGLIIWGVIPFFVFPKTKIAWYLYFALMLIYFPVLIEQSAYYPAGYFYHFVYGSPGSYAYLPVVLYSWLLVLSFLQSGVMKKLMASVFLLLMLILTIHDYHFESDARQNDVHWSSYAALAKSNAKFSIPILPYPLKIECVNYSCDNERNSIFYNMIYKTK